MLTSLIKEHEAKQHQRREEQEKKRKAAIQSSSNLTKALVDHLNVGVAQAYLNQKRLDAEATQLEQNALQFHKATTQWLGLVSTFSTALKEVGHVQNWAATMQEEMQTIADTLENAYNTSQASTSSLP